MILSFVLKLAQLDHYHEHVNLFIVICFGLDNTLIQNIRKCRPESKIDILKHPQRE